MASIFLSYSGSDNAIAERLATDLRALGHTPWMDRLDLRTGDHIPAGIASGIASADYLVVLLTKEGVASKWVDREWQEKYFDEVSLERTVVLPILLEDCEIPTLLRTKKVADFRDSYEQGLLDLLRGLAHGEQSKTALLHELKTMGLTSVGLGETEETFRGMLKTAVKQLWLVLISGGDQVRRHHAEISAWLRASGDRHLFVATINPNNSHLLDAISQMTGKLDAKQYRNQIDETSRRFALALEEFGDRVQLRTYDSAPAATLIAADPELASGKIYVEHYIHGQPWTKRPYFVVARGGPYYAALLDGVTKLWDSARSVPVPAARRKTRR